MSNLHLSISKRSQNRIMNWRRTVSFGSWRELNPVIGRIIMSKGHNSSSRIYRRATISSKDAINSPFITVEVGNWLSKIILVDFEIVGGSSLWSNNFYYHERCRLLHYHFMWYVPLLITSLGIQYPSVICVANWGINISVGLPPAPWLDRDQSGKSTFDSAYNIL